MDPKQDTVQEHVIGTVEANQAEHEVGGLTVCMSTEAITC